jgi:hypothetical protein
MRYSLLALITLLLISGCAPRQTPKATPGRIWKYGCREVSIDAKTGDTTVICPNQEVKK